MNVTPYTVAQKFIGVQEAPGSLHNPTILAMLRLDNPQVEADELAWCSALINYVCYLLGLPRSKSLAARSWLLVGQTIPVEDAQVGFDVVVLKRGGGVQPGPEVTKGAPGHVGFFAGFPAAADHQISLLGGNQHNEVNITRFLKADVLGVRRLPNF